MNALQGLLLPLLLGLGVNQPGSVQDLSWHPVAGSKLRREIVSRHVLTIESQKSGSEDASFISQRKLELESTQKLTVTDVLDAVSTERPLKFLRYYNLAEFEVNMESSAGGLQVRDDKYVGVGTLTDNSVVFTWLPEEKEYGRYFGDKPGTEELLPLLVENLGMRDLMSNKAVTMGTTWELPPHALKEVFATGGEVDYELEGGNGFDMLRMMRMGIGLDVEQVFGGLETGQVTVAWNSSVEEEGRELAELRLDFKVHLEKDMKDRAQAGMTLREVRMGLSVHSNVVSMDLEGGGLVRWDVAAGRLHDTKDLKANQRVGYKLVTARRTDGEPQLETQELVMIGTLNHSVKVMEDEAFVPSSSTTTREGGSEAGGGGEK